MLDECGAVVAVFADELAGLVWRDAGLFGEVLHLVVFAGGDTGAVAVVALTLVVGQAIASRPDQLLFVAFDLLHYDGFDLRPMAVEERRHILGDLIEPGGRVQFSQELKARRPIGFGASSGPGWRASSRSCGSADIGADRRGSG